MKFLYAYMIAITGTVGSSGKYLVTGMPVDTTATAVIKIAFMNDTAGTNLVLWAGSIAQFTAGGAGTIRLSDSGGPGFQFLTVIDTQKIAGMVLYVQRAVGTAASTFTINIE
jgi:hypothetical protein